MSATAPTIREVQELIAERFGLSVSELLSRRQDRYLARPRQIAMWICRNISMQSSPLIGMHFGRDHSTVLQANQRMEAEMRKDAGFADIVWDLAREAEELPMIRPQVPPNPQTVDHTTDDLWCRWSAQSNWKVGQVTEHRWSKFWWADHRGDPCLRMCGLAARGIWVDLLCIAHEGSPYGHVTINGKSPTNRQIAMIVGGDEKKVASLIKELEEAGVFSRTSEGIIYSRRMVRDAIQSAKGAYEVSKRWGDGEISGKSRSQKLAAARRKGTHSDAEWCGLLEVCGDLCLRCGKGSAENGGGVVKDHITPIYQGGSDAIENIQPMCQPCNAQKGPEAKDYRRSDWRERLEERLGYHQKTPSGTPTECLLLEAESESDTESEAEKSTPLTPRKREVACQDDFEDFWNRYPRKVGKGQARKAFGIALKKTTAAVLLKAVSDQRWHAEERFQPHASTWLNGERWLDKADNFDPVLRAVGLKPEDFEDELEAGYPLARMLQ